MGVSTYAVVIEKSNDGYGAYVPDLPGCVAVAETFDETERLIRKSIELHLEAMREDSETIPTPTTRVIEFEVA